MPTGVAMRDAREQLFSAAERILVRSGPNALTSRAVTTEAGCAKGVLHRHFADFDDFLAELVHDRVARLAVRSAALRGAAGTGTVTGNLTGALTELFEPVAMAILGLIIFRDGLRARLRAATPVGVPLLTEAMAMLAGYLSDERQLGRIAADAEIDPLALALLGGAQMLVASRETAPPDPEAVERLVATTMADVLQRRLL